MKAYFFGCWDRPGHFFHEPGGLYTSRPRGCPWMSIDIDGSMQPGCRADTPAWQVEQTQGPARLHHRDGWSMLTFWDRSVDERRNSNGNFIFEGTHTFERMMELAQQHFPEVVKRLAVPLYPEVL